jgi:hypothetical protein
VTWRASSGGAEAQGEVATVNGRPGDHPRTDLLIHGLEVYGQETDDLLRGLLKLMPHYAFDEWFESLRPLSGARIRQMASEKLAELREDAKERGWEADEG